MREKKIDKALVSAMNCLKASIKALVEKDERSVVDSIWEASAELEYALFLFSLTNQEEADRSSWKLDSPLKKVEIGPTLVSAQALLEQAKSFMDVNDVRKANKKTWIARGHLLKVWKSLMTK